MTNEEHPGSEDDCCAECPDHDYCILQGFCVVEADAEENDEEGEDE